MTDMGAAMAEDHTAVRVRVSGRVQGVSFRVWVWDEAERLGLTGWVRNEADGTVTALLVGPEARVSSMVAAMWRGPPAARVSNVVTECVEPEVAPSEFRIRS